MNFELDEDQQMLRDSVRRYLEKAYGFEQRREIAARGGLDREQWTQFAEMGWLAVGLPESVGGYGGFNESALVLEEFGRALVLEPYLSCAVHAGQLLLNSGAGDVEALLAPLISGEQLYGVAHTEPQARGRPLWVQTRATRSAQGYVLDGTKTLVPGGDAADRFLVSARVSGDAEDTQGIALFLVDRDTPGLGLRPYALVDGSRAADLSFDGMTVPVDALLGSESGAGEVLEQAGALATIGCCAQMLGAIDVALWITRDYLNTRKQFGVAIGSFQALQHRMADMYIALEQARSMVYRGLAAAESGDRAALLAAASSSKAQLGRSAQFVGAQSIQLHGGIGVTEEYSIGHYFKHLLVLESLQGSSAYHLGRIAQSLRAA